MLRGKGIDDYLLHGKMLRMPSLKLGCERVIVESSVRDHAPEHNRKNRLQEELLRQILRKSCDDGVYEIGAMSLVLLH